LHSSEQDFLARAPTLLAWLHSRPERCIAVVGHGLQQLRDIGERLGNGEARWYRLEEGGGFVAEAPAL